MLNDPTKKANLSVTFAMYAGFDQVLSVRARYLGR